MSRSWLIRAFVLMLPFTLILSLAAQTALAERSSAKADLLVMSFNIRYGRANDGANNWDQRKDMACEVVRRQNPDLIGLQEALRSQIDDMRAALPEYGEIGCGTVSSGVG